MNLYDCRKQIQKIYNDSVYGNIKGDIYSELDELRIDNQFIISVSSDSTNKRITFKLEDYVTSSDISNLFEQIKEVIRSFIYKNMFISPEMDEFLNSNLYFDSYFIDESKLVIVQL